MVSRPSSGWDRVGHRRHGHQAVEPAFRAIDACFSEPRAPPATSVALAILAQARLLRLIAHGCHHLRGERRDVRRTPGASADIEGGILQMKRKRAVWGKGGSVSVDLVG